MASILIPLEKKVAEAGQSGFCALKEANVRMSGFKVTSGASSNENTISFLLMSTWDTSMSEVLHTVSEVSSRGGAFLADDSSEDAEEAEAMLGIDDSVWAAALCVPQETVKKVSKENTRQKSFFMTVILLNDS